MEINEIKEILVQKGLKITPQRMAVLDAIYELHNHPTADDIIGFIKDKYPNIAIGTVYKILDTFFENKIIKKVETEGGIMRYDGIVENHHHLYCAESDRIEDYFDEELNNMINSYFEKREIPNFKIKDIKLQIIGKFLDKKRN